MRDIDNLIYLKTDVKSGEEDSINYEDVVFFTSSGITGTYTNEKTFGVICDDASGETKRAVAIYGTVEASLSSDTFFDGVLVVYSTLNDYFKLATTNANGIYIRGKIYIFDNRIY